MTKEKIKPFIEIKQADMPFEVEGRTETMRGEGQTVVTHVEEAAADEWGHRIRVVPTWKWLAGDR